MAPTRWPEALPVVTGQVRWRPAAPGVDLGELDVAGTGTAWRMRLILVRVDPGQVDFEVVLPRATGPWTPGRWTIADAPRDALVAFNAGQFSGGPWGWVVRDGVQLQPAGTGPLAPGIAVDTAGRVRLVPVDSLAAVLHGTRQGFQSYPVLLHGGRVPAALRQPGEGVDLTHRDARLALGVLPDGHLLLALTRFQGLGGLLELVPFGFTTPEMAAIMGALGTRDAVLMDGGISSQLLVQSLGRRRTWPGLRPVAMGLVLRPRYPR